jgi:serine protease inhibitor
MKHSFFKAFLTAAMATGLMLACTDDKTVTPNEVHPVVIPEAIAAGTTDFAFDFFKNLQETQPTTDNLFVSPLGLHMALGMLLNGADGGTASEVLKSLKMEGVDLVTLNNTYKTLITDMPKADSKVEFQLANSIWAKEGIQLESVYSGLLKNSFNAEINTLPFDNNAIKRINQWASDNTNGKIDKVIEEIDPDLVLFLMNAIYFKGDWQSKFDKNDTKDTPFKLENGTNKNVKMMFQKSDFKLANTETYGALQMPYANGQFNITLILPKNSQEIGTVMNTLNLQTWNDLQKNKFNEFGVKVGLPRFKFKGKVDLNNTLSKMGFMKMFSDAAEFGKITKSAALKVDFVKQDSYLGIDEKGTEAAAVTTIGFETTSVGPGSTPEFICDRPFGLIISENTSNTVLFMGRIMNPESE